MTSFVGLGVGAGLAAAGAVGLGLLGLAAIAGRGRRRSGRRRHHGRRHRHRHGRSVEDEPEALQRVMDLIRQEDETECGMRYVCDLATMSTDQLLEEEQAILDLVGPTVKPGEGVLPSGGIGDYKLAKSFGENAGNCDQAFLKCPINSTQLMDTVTAYLP